MPRHLDGFELALVGFLRVVFEVRQLRYVLVRVGKADCERIDVGMGFREFDSDIVSVVPSEFFWHESSRQNFLSFGFRSFKKAKGSFAFRVSGFKFHNTQNFETPKLRNLVFFRNVIAIPGRNLDRHFAGLQNLRLTAEARV